MKREEQFEQYLLKDVPRITSEKAVRKRMSLIRDVEKTLGIVIDDYMTEEKMEDLIKSIRKFDNQKAGRQNAVRHYYTFVTGEVLPKIKNA